jgi:hypothetical protein
MTFIKRLQDAFGVGFDVALLIFLNDGGRCIEVDFTYIRFGIQSLFCALESCMLLKSNAIFLHDSTLIIMDWYQDHFETGRPEFERREQSYSLCLGEILQKDY